YILATLINPEFFEAYNNLSVIYRKQKKFDDAIVECKRALEIKPDNELVLYNLGRAYYDKGQLNKSIKSFQKILQVNPDYKQLHLIYHNIGVIYYEQGKTTKAIEELIRAIKKRADYIPAYINLGNIYLSQGNEDKAAKLFEKATKINPKSEVLKRIAQKLK